jgi:hypothetical protein
MYSQQQSVKPLSSSTQTLGNLMLLNSKKSLSSISQVKPSAPLHSVSSVNKSGSLGSHALLLVKVASGHCASLPFNSAIKPNAAPKVSFINQLPPTAHTYQLDLTNMLIPHRGLFV